MNSTITPELDAKLADIIRNSPAWKKTEEINADVQKSVAHTNAAVEAASKVKIDQEVFDDIAKQSAACREIAVEANDRVKKMDAAIENAANIKVNQEALDDIAKKSAICKNIAVEAHERVESMNEIIRAVGSMKFEFVIK